MAWVSVHQQVANHRKTRDLFRRLRKSRQEAIGYLVLIWLWGIDNVDRSGKLLSATIRDIEEAAYWTGKEGVLYRALVDSHWIDEFENGVYLHDWEDFNKPFYQYVDRKERDKLRKREGKSTGNSMENRAEFRDSPSPSPSPSPKDRELDIEQHPKTDPLKIINDKAMEFGMNGLTPEFRQDAESRLSEGTDSELIIKALSIGATKAEGSGNSKCRYAISILQNWAGEGIKTMQQWNEKYLPKPSENSKAQNRTPKKSSNPFMDRVKELQQNEHK